MIERKRHIQDILESFEDFTVVGVIGPRQVGKTTLAHQVARNYSEPARHFDLERGADLDRLATDPEFVLTDQQGLVVLDEVQRLPGIYTTLRVLADRRPGPTKFLVLGSASPTMLQQTSESLAGRIRYHNLSGLGLYEIQPELQDSLWLRGGFPRSFLARSDQRAFVWLEELIHTFLTRDMPAMGLGLSPTLLRRFWTMLAHLQGQVWNASEIGRSLELSDVSVRRYLDMMSDALLIRLVQPWYANIKKRQVKSPRIYFRDVGLLHALLGISSTEELLSHPKAGASWEGFVMEQVIDLFRLRDHRVFFWRAHTGAEVDMVVQRGTELVGIEIKRTSSPSVTKSIRSALADLELAAVFVIHAGKDSYPLTEKVRAVSVYDLQTELHL